jgi:hypothetical protein
MAQQGILWQLVSGFDPLGQRGLAGGIQQRQQQENILQQLAGQEMDRQFRRETDARDFQFRKDDTATQRAIQERGLTLQERNAAATQDLARAQFDFNKNNVGFQQNLALAQFNRKEDPEKVRLARAAGLTPGTPEWQQFITGDQQKLGSADKKAIFEAEDALAPLQSQAATLKRALELNDKTYSGIGARTMGQLGSSGIPGAGYILDANKANATREFDQILSLEAIKSMSDNLKGASTDRELFEFQRILSDPSTPPDIRKRTIERMLSLTERQAQIKQGRMDQIRGNTYFKPQQQNAQQQTLQPAAGDALAQARTAIANGKDPNAVRQRLMQLGIDPQGL